MELEDAILEEPLTPHEVLQIPYIEKFWNKNGFFPPVAKLVERGIQNPHLLYKKPAFIKAMDNRGISIHDNPTAPVDLDFTKAQMAAIMVMTDYLDKRSAQSKLRNLGLTTTQWNGWMKQEAFKNYVHNLSAKVFDDAIHSAQNGLAKRLEEGDVNAIKYYYEVTGRHNGDSGNVQNVRLLITKLVEVLQRRIEDPELLAAIGHDFNIILEGGTVAPQIPAEHVLPGVNSEL